MEQWQNRVNDQVTVEAVRLNEDNVSDVALWCGAQAIEEIDPEHPEEMQTGLNVPTPSGTKRASLGMYVAKFGSHFFVSHNRPFEAMYVPVNRDAPPPESIADSRRARGFADPWGGVS